jgi:hypothetical protein
MVKHEKPQKKNRRLLTVRQHVFPAKSIARFADVGGQVSLQDLVRGKERPAKPDDAIFCARRAWDQRAERYMKKIEDEFQILAAKVIEGVLTEIGEAENGVFNRFYAFGISALGEEPYRSKRLDWTASQGAVASIETRKRILKSRVIHLCRRKVLRSPH